MILILKDEKHFRETKPAKILSAKLVAYGLPTGNFKVTKACTTGSFESVSSYALSALIVANS